MSESKDLSQRTNDGDVAPAPRQTGFNFDTLDKRTNDLYNLGACYLILQRLLYLRDLLAVKLRKIGVDDDSHVVFLGSQLSIDLVLAGLQAPQLIAYGARIAVTSCYEIQATFDTALYTLQLSYQASLRSMTFLLEAAQFALELSRELVDERLVSLENILEPIQNAVF